MVEGGTHLNTKRSVFLGESTAGFTLIEVMWSVALIALGFTLATPAYLTWIARSDLKQGLTEIYSGLKLTKTAAISQNTTVTMNLQMAGSNVQWAVDNGVVGPTVLRDNVTGVVGGNVVFTSLGIRQSGAPGANQLITLTNSQGLIYSIAVTPAGKINWCTKAICP